MIAIARRFARLLSTSLSRNFVYRLLARRSIAGLLRRCAPPLLGAAVAASGPATAWAQNAGTVDSPWVRNINAEATKALGDAGALGLAAIPLDGPGQAQYLNADTLMSPGSIVKVITTYAALEILGPNYRWDTTLLTDGRIEGEVLKGNLYLRFGGDPKLTIERLWTTLGELPGMGIRRIDGNLVLDGSHYRLAAGQPAFEDNGDNPNAPFLVAPSPYLSNLNLQQFHLLADERGVRAWATPALPQVAIDNQVKAAPAGTCPGRDDFTWQPVASGDGRITLTVSGTLPRNCRSSTYLSLLPQATYSAALIRKLLTDYGVAITGQDALARAPDTARELASTTSPDLVTMVRDVNKWSSNVMARSLLLTIGAHTRGEQEQDDVAAGLRALRSWLESKGVDTAGLVIDNGAGLSRASRLTPRQVLQLLQQAWRSPFAVDLLSSMPIIATDGTMTRRLRNTALAGEGRIKTGSLDHVRSIAGFVRDRNQTTWAVAAMVNHNPAWNGQAVLDKVLYNLHYKPPAS
ncbi:D-alanyl-D-alanine carboxypeptidase/D-alanyl-D-alanine endopeptidase [Parahaliea mediterranea]|uniref:D-alanyl-D-alanine carboxypeptidase/D-alanyl-D-alanine endopeptidase n=1 Tax=Parahaliea mediterranea TaxID=651086 RepID=UPI0019D48A91|nr:D-alanyl-D-alanine carboxypeptidase/D-alanyl-D-alanine-endopeptidase [Parahaliea mediterranea]